MQRKHLIILTIMLLSLIWPTLLLAQTRGDVVVDGIETVETGDHVLLRVHFTVDGGETAVSTATVQLEDGSQYPASLKKPPYYVALVLDGSKSMEPVFAEVKQAAIDFVNAAPPEVQFSVIGFTDNIDLMQPYTGDHAQVINAINRLQPKDSNICFYDVAYTATKSLEQIAPTASRAMILFTDGQGEAQPGSSSQTCIQYTNAELVAAAANRQDILPVYIVGIAETENKLNSDTLTKLAAATGGFYIDGTTEAFRSQLQTIQSDIGGHWIAEANTTPAQGIQRGSLLLTMEDGSLPAPGPLVFNSSADYRPLVQPVEPAVHISNFRYDKLTDSFSFDTSLINLDNAAQMLTEARDKESNIQVEMKLIQNPSVLQQVRLSADNMVANHRYKVVVVLRDSSGNLITNEAGLPISDTYEFQYDPPQPFNLVIESIVIEDEPARFNFETLKLEDDTATLVVEYHTSGLGEAVVLNGRLLNQSTNQRTELFTLETIEPGIAQSTIQAENGSYTLVVNALNEAGDIMSTASHSFTTNSPDNAVMRSGKAVRSNPLLMVMFIIMGVGIAFLAWRFGHNLGYTTAYKHLPAGLNLNAISQTAEVEEAAPLRAALTLVGSPDESLTEINRWEITQFPFTIGREDCDITITKDRHVSRKHAQITFENNDYFIQDLGSSNGTFVNDTQIATREPMPLRSDKATRLQIGKTTSFIFNVEADDEPETSPVVL